MNSSPSYLLPVYSREPPGLQLIPLTIMLYYRFLRPLLKKHFPPFSTDSKKSMSLYYPQQKSMNVKNAASYLCSSLPPVLEWTAI